MLAKLALSRIQGNRYKWIPKLELVKDVINGVSPASRRVLSNRNVIQMLMLQKKFWKSSYCII